MSSFGARFSNGTRNALEKKNKLINDLNLGYETVLLPGNWCNKFEVLTTGLKLQAIIE